MKKLLLGALALVAMSTVANAALNQFYETNAGQWTVEGYTGDKNFCAAKTYWDDGSYVSLFETKRGENGLYVHNTDWNIGDPRGTSANYVGNFIFTSVKYGADSGSAVYEVIDNQTVVIRDLNANFFNNWLSYDDFTISMPGNIGEFVMGLEGTASLARPLLDCLYILERK